LREGNAFLPLIKRHHGVHVGQRRLGWSQSLRRSAADIGVCGDRIGLNAVAIVKRRADDQQRARLAGLGG
jgi:hypothetical protein